MNAQATIEKYKKLIQEAEREEAMLQGKLEETDSQLEELCGCAEDSKVDSKIKEHEEELEGLRSQYDDLLEELEKCKWK